MLILKMSQYNSCNGLKEKVEKIQELGWKSPTLLFPYPHIFSFRQERAR